MTGANRMKQQPRKRQRNRKRAPAAKLLKWAVAVAVVLLAVYVVFQTSGVAYDEDDIRVVNFSDLSPRQKRTALQAANRARCTCGCGMNVAQWVSTDMTCPIRDRNIESIRDMVRDAAGG